MNTLTKQSDIGLASGRRASRWKAVARARPPRRRRVRLRRHVRPASTAGRRARAGGRGAIASRSSTTPGDARERRLPRLQALPPDARGRPAIRGSRRSGAPACTSPTSTAIPSLATLAARLGGSPYHLQRNFKRLVGVTPREYAEACRLRKVKRRLRQGGRRHRRDARRGLRIEQPVLRARGAEARHVAVGLSARRRRHEHSATRSSTRPLGRLLVAATARGVCAVAMGASDAELERALAREYPAAAIAPTTGALARWTSAILAHLAGRRPRLDLPLDVQATAFQWQVWQALAAIPYGETRTYSEVAAAIGRPTRRARRRARVRDQSGRARDSLSPRRAGRRRRGRLSLGRGRKAKLLARERRA